MGGLQQVQAKNLSLVYKKRRIRRTAVEFQLWICLEELAKERGRKRGREGERRQEGGRKGEELITPTREFSSPFSNKFPAHSHDHIVSVAGVRAQSRP